MDPGDAILCEKYTYPHVPESLIAPVDFSSIGIEVDNDGIIPEHLRQTLQDIRDAGGKMPKLLYTVPVGQNPTGKSRTPLGFLGSLCENERKQRRLGYDSHSHPSSLVANEFLY